MTSTGGISILNDVIGPVMRGPSSSHTAGPFFIGKVIRSMLAEDVRQAVIRFDPAGSFAHVYRDQCSDVGFAAGLLNMGITDDAFHRSIEIARQRGIDVRFEVAPLGPDWQHPNAVAILATDVRGRKLSVVAESVGGGQIRIAEINGTRLSHRGHRPAVLIVGTHPDLPTVLRKLGRNIDVAENRDDVTRQTRICTGTAEDLAKVAQAVRSLDGCTAWPLPAIGLIAYHAPELTFADVESLLRAAEARQPRIGLAQLGIDYESQLLRLDEVHVGQAMEQRWQTMKSAMNRGVGSSAAGMRFLAPTAAQLQDAGARGVLPCGGLLADAAAAALAVMEQNSTGGVVCAAPTAGSAGIIPGLLYALQQQRHLDDATMARALFATGVIGVMISTRATFAAETCACAAETGAAAAMAAAAIVDLHGGTVRQALDAATMCLMNTIGLTCDPVQGAVEIPCHARNLAGVAHALVASDSVLGGFRAVLPLDETIDAMLAVGRAMHANIRCTSTGGLAATPTAHALVPLHVHHRNGG